MASASHPPGASRSPQLWEQLLWTAKLVQAVRAGKSLATQLGQVPGNLRPGVQALTFHTLRHLGTATAVRARLAAKRPPAESDALLCAALALMLDAGDERYPLHTLAHQAVEAAQRGRATRNQAGLINACLRRFAREREAVLGAAVRDPVARWNYQLWWIERVQADHPDAWQTILSQAQQPAPMVLRVNRLRGTVGQALAALDAAEIRAQALEGDAIELARPMPVTAIPGFAQGRVSVQSAAAQRAAPLLLSGLTTDAPRVLDACAAPGGKTAHMLELCPQARMTALELDAGRSERIAGTLQRLGLQAQIQVADAARVSDWWDGEPFDRIMLDAPCSASGIVRRHPDIRWLRRETDIAQLAAQQDRLLEALWKLLVPSGRLLYVTCSVFREEGADRVQAFLARHSDAGLRPSPGHVLPSAYSANASAGENAPCDDGFYYALLEKRPPQRGGPPGRGAGGLASCSGSECAERRAGDAARRADR